MQIASPFRQKKGQPLLVDAYKMPTKQAAASEHLIPSPVKGRTQAGAQKNLPHVLSNTPLHRDSFVLLTVRDWNKLPLSARLAKTVVEYKAALKT